MKREYILPLLLALLLNSSLLTNNCLSQWDLIITPDFGSIKALTVSGTNIFAATDSGIYVSANNGSNWTAANNGISNKDIYTLSASGSVIIAGTQSPAFEVYLSTDNGAYWTTVINGFPFNHTHGFAFSGSNIFAATHLHGVYLTTNNGTLWTSAGNLGSVSSIVVSGINIFAGTLSHSVGVYLSTNNGANWTPVNSGLPNPYGVRVLLASGTNIFAGNDAGVFLTTNNGANWNEVNNGIPEGTSIFSFAASGTNIFAGTSFEGVYYTSNNGANWINKNRGANYYPYISELLIAYGYIFAVKGSADSNTLWRRSLEEIIGIQNITTEIPGKYSLSQNYPNPFNPVTKIRFSIPKVSVGQTLLFVTLKIYDVSGREIRTLVNESLAPGTYETTFDGSMLNSGIYFYKLITNDYTESKKMILIK
jgi:hypothetical protein